MQDSLDKQKIKHILPFLSRLVQEMIVPYTDNLHTWEEVKEALLAEFGLKQSLNWDKQAFMSLSNYEGKTTAAFSERFYLTAQRLLTFNMLTLDDAIGAMLIGLPSQPSLAKHIISLKRYFKTICNIKEALLDVANFHCGATIKEADVESFFSTRWSDVESSALTIE